MIARLKVIGDGTPDDPYRVNLPTYLLLDHDIKAKTMLVEIPDFEHPFDEGGLTNLRLTKETGTEIVIAASADALELWHAHLDERYAEHSGSFRVEFAK